MPVDPDEQLALAAEGADELAELEETRTAALLGRHASVAQDLERRFVRLWLELFAELDYTPTPEELAGFLRRYRALLPASFAELDPTTTALNLAGDAARIAARAAITEADVELTPPRPRVVLNDPRLAAGIRSGADVPGQLLDRLRVLSGEGQRGTTLLLEQRAAFGVARARASGVARWSANAAANRARTLVADELGAGTVWVTERDACVHCLAYAGEVALPGRSFPVGLSFDPAGGLPAFRDELPEPPLHPHCRCQVTPWSPAWGTALPDALRREAERSVLKGWALPTETEAARARAAAQLLEDGPQELDVKSVRRQARRDLAAGSIRKPPPTRP